MKKETPVILQYLREAYERRNIPFKRAVAAYSVLQRGGMDGCQSKPNRVTHIAGGTELPLSVFDLRTEFLQQGLLHPPDGRGLPASLQSQLGATHTHTNTRTYTHTHTHTHTHTIHSKSTWQHKYIALIWRDLILIQI